MVFSDCTQGRDEWDDDATMRHALAQIEAEPYTRHDDLLAQLDAVGVEGATAPERNEEPSRKFLSFGGQFQDPDPEDPDIIIEPVRPTRYDKARAKLKEVEEKLAALREQPSPDPKKLLVAEVAVDHAKKMLERALTEASQKQDNIDAWRQTPEGREKRNSDRRDRPQPNADVKNMTPEDAKQHKREQGWTRVNRHRFLKEGLEGAELEAKLTAGLLKFRAKCAADAARLAAKAKADAEVREEREVLTNIPGFGAF